MKRILFLSYNYPSGNFGPSTNCTTRIMKKLCESGNYKISCVSYESRGVDAYDYLPGIELLRLPIKAKRRLLPRWAKQFLTIIKIPLFPFGQLFASHRLYRATRDLIRGMHFDLVICQYLPEESLLSGVWLKKHGQINNLMVIFWDNIYGKLPRRIIPKHFALRRHRWAEGFVAKYADQLVSLYPIKSFHEKYGELPEAKGKREYLGIPSVIRPQVISSSEKQGVIVSGKINILYSGTIFRESYVEYLVDLLNDTPLADQINLVFFQRGVSSEKWDALKKRFRGSIYSSGWIPLQDLLAFYSKADFFISFPGVPTSICSKLYEYVSYGKPILVLYDDDTDVNITAFSRYPAFYCVDTRCRAAEKALDVSFFIQSNNGRTILFEECERLFAKDSPQAFVELIDKILEKNKS